MIKWLIILNWPSNCLRSNSQSEKWYIFVMLVFAVLWFNEPEKTWHFSILSNNKRIVSVLNVFHLNCAHNVILIDNMPDLIKILHLVFCSLHRGRCHLLNGISKLILIRKPTFLLHFLINLTSKFSTFKRSTQLLKYALYYKQWLANKWNVIHSTF